MEAVKSELRQHVLYVTLSRPERMNAFNSQMIQDLTAVFVGARTQSDLAAVVLTGAGKSFCAGADLEYMKAMAKFSQAQNLADSEQLFAMFEAIRQTSVPVIARVQGSVFGGGVGLAAACDLVAAEPTTQFCFSEVRLGLIPAVISSFVLSKMTAGFARAMMISGLVFSAEEALHAGLVHFVGDESQCQTWVDAAIKQARANGREAMRKTKELCDHLSAVKIENQKTHTTRLIAEQRVSAEGQEGIAAFLEKRKASWAR